MKLPVLSIEEVCSRQLCTGCGACASVEPERFRMGDAVEYGRRPFLPESPAAETGEARSVCPGARLVPSFLPPEPVHNGELTEGWGPVNLVGVGDATDAV
ncbi:MAG: ferredoxin, partial [Phycisphaerales bacterium JB050]